MSKWVSKSVGVEGFFVMKKGAVIKGKLTSFNGDPGGDAKPFYVLNLIDKCEAKVKNDPEVEGFDDTLIDEETGEIADYRVATIEKGENVGVSAVTALKGLEENIGRTVTIKVLGTKKARVKSHSPSYILDVDVT